MQFVEIRYDSEQYHQSWDLRQRVLREPLDLHLTDADRRQDSADWHFGLVDGATVIACVIASPAALVQVKLRQMAVEPGLHGRGLGAQLLSSAEAVLGRRGLCNIVLHARMAAVGFYQRLGYAACGEAFTSVGIDHIAMHKQLDLSLRQ